MLKLGSTALATVVMLAVYTHAQGVHAPLFSAFKAFCIDTGAKPDLIKTVVESGGGKLFRGPVNSDAWPFVVGLTIWNVPMSGQSLNVSAGTQHIPPTASRLKADFDDCTVNSYVADEASIAAIRKWLGVSPTRTSVGALTIYFYDYQEIGSQRSAVPTEKTAYDAAKAEGRIWSLVLLDSHKSASVQLTHIPATR